MEVFEWLKNHFLDQNVVDVVLEKRLEKKLNILKKQGTVRLGGTDPRNIKKLVPGILLK